MAIKKVGGPGRVAPAQPIESKSAATVEGFGKVAEAAQTQPNAPTEVAQAVQEVAVDVAAGRLSDPQTQIDAVIERMVRLQAPEGASSRAVSSRVMEVQLALGDHPGFSERVQVMLANALEANEA
ncbi:MAG: hypothetical protein ACJAYU_003838 [Bradymonadia bacterium]|jgi:hypothetical protein